MIRWIVSLFLSGALMLLGFCGIDFAFLAESCIYVPVLHVCVDAGDFWNVNWIIIVSGEALGIMSAFKLGS